MEVRNSEDTGVRRRGFLKASGGLLATAMAGTAGCISADGSETEIGYRRWVPATFDPALMYVDVDVLGEHHSLWESGGENSQYGLTFDGISEVIGTSGAEILVLNEDAEPDIADDEGTAWDDYNGYTVHRRESGAGGFVANSGDVVIEAQTQGAIESVVDAREGDAARIHEQDESFEGLTTKAGEGDIVFAPGVNGRTVRRKEVRSADVTEGTSDIRIAIEADEGDFGDIEDSVTARNVTVEEVIEEDTEAGIVVLVGTVETEAIPEAFGLVGSSSSSSTEVQGSGGVGESESEAESGSMSESEAESGSTNESEAESGYE